MEDMKIFLEKKREETIKQIEEFISKYSYTENETKLIIEFLALHQLIDDERVKAYLISEISKRCDNLFICKLNVINNEYKHLIKEYVLNHYSYRNFKERFS